MAARETIPAEIPAPGGDEVAGLRAEVARLRIENQLLRERIDQVLRQLFGSKSEALDPAQLELLLDPDAAKKADAAEAAAPADPEPAAEAPPAKKRSPRKPRDLSHLEVRETVLIHDDVKLNPTAFRELERILTDRLDFQPSSIFIDRTVRVVHVAIGQPDAVPILSLIHI